jgi:glutamine---fructose-6-phosphate transaminase (isomerizing)
MCGIFGITVGNESNLTVNVIDNTLRDLFIYSESRGKEASGVAFKNKSGTKILKSGLSASQLIDSNSFLSIKNELLNSSDNALTAIGHSRLVTNGRASLNVNNQPVTKRALTCIHNGIITNDKELFTEIGTEPSSECDTEALVSLIDEYRENNNFIDAIKNSFLRIEGQASCAFLDDIDESMVLASNHGSMYYFFDENKQFLIFTSEQKALEDIVIKNFGKDYFLTNQIFKVKANSLVRLDLKIFQLSSDSWKKNDAYIDLFTNSKPKKYYKVADYSSKDYPDFYDIKRCTKCILPHTFPYIEFDKKGECNYCKNHLPQGPRDHDLIKEIIKPYKNLTNSYGQNCIVGLSGGRDSCYGMHYVKEELGLNPVAFTYDWGMVTDIARRNVSRMCGELGVEHILVSADIKQKRQNVRMNIEAWLKKPELFMIPLFMAGDKQFYLHAHKLRKQLGIKLFMFGAGNTLETTDFKVGFANIKNNSTGGILTKLKNIDKLRLLSKYGLEFLKNPSYLNKSLFDTFEGFYSSYLLKDDYTYLYHHIPWIESEVESVLMDKYGWEGASDTKTSWRVGDGTAAFYNYIYFTVAGFTEHDTFRSNQIREGMINREEALNLVSEENQPRWETLEWYAKTIGFNLDDALLTIHKIPRLY